MKVGDLVRIKRTFIGVPQGTIGLIISKPGYSPGAGCHDLQIFELRLVPEHPEWGQRTKRYIAQDLEIISEGR